jgi:hypothetical protein
MILFSVEPIPSSFVIVALAVHAAVRIGLVIAIPVAPLDNIAIESIPMPWRMIFGIATRMILVVVGVITIEPIVYFYIAVRVDLVIPRRHPRFSFSSPAPLLEMAFQFRPVHFARE